MSYQSEWLELQGAKIRVLHGGSGEPLLYLHGASGGGNWLPFFEHLSQHFTVYAPEHPGFGLSDDPEWLEEMSDLALFYKDFIDHYGWDKVHLVGHSMGGWLSAEFTTLFNERVKSLTLIDAAGIHVDGVEIGDNFMWHPDEQARKMFFNQELAQQRIDKAMSEEDIAIDVKNRTTVAKLVWTPRWYSLTLRKRLYRIQVPTLVVWGREDNLFPVQHAYAYQELIHGAQLQVVPECGHSPQVEKPDEVVAAISQFALQ